MNLFDLLILSKLWDGGVGQLLPAPSGSDAGKVLSVDSQGGYALADVTHPLPRAASVSLGASWTGAGPYTQAVTLAGVTAHSKVDLQPDAAAISQLIADGVQALYLVNNNGTLTAWAVGACPTAALTVQAVITEVAA